MDSGALRQGSIYSIGNIQGYKVLVARQFPRGADKSAFDVWYKDLAPHNKLLRARVRGKITDEDFAQEYRSQLRHDYKAQRLIKQLKQKKDVILLTDVDNRDWYYLNYLVEEIGGD